MARAFGESPHDARRCGDNSRRTRHFSLLGSESDGALVLFGTYSFPPKVYEITVVSRLASPVSTFVVETCHPLDGVNPLFSCFLPARQVGDRSIRNAAPSCEPLNSSESRFSQRGTPQHKRTDRQLCSQTAHEIAEGVDEIAVGHIATAFLSDFLAQRNSDAIEA